MDYSKFNEYCQQLSNKHSDDVDFTKELIDISETTNKRRKWQEYKQSNIYLAGAYTQIDDDKAIKLLNCAEYLAYDVNEYEKKHLSQVYFCRIRLCPVCSWRRSLRLFADNMKIVQYIDSHNREFGKINYLFVTLTVKNCVADKLSSTLDSILKAYNDLLRRKCIRSSWRGCVRHLEVTHNVNRDSSSFDTYHPHLHLLVAVDAGAYFGRKYISTFQLRQLWADCLHITDEQYRNNLQVDIRVCKNSTAEAVAEVSKYASKSKDYIILDDWDLTVDTVNTLDNALRNRRLVSYSGIFNVVKKMLKIEDVEKADLVHIEDDEQEQLSENVVRRDCYWWHFGYSQYYKLK